MQIRAIEKRIAKAISIVSKSQNYQNKLFISLCFVFVQIAYSAFLNSFILTNPLLYCQGKKTNQEYFCQYATTQKCQYLNNYSGTYYANLYCENRGVRMSLQSIFPIGGIIGVFAIPLFSDIKGKRKATLTSLLLLLLGEIALFFGIYSRAYYLAGIGQFLCSFSTSSLVALSYSINSDYFSDDLRRKALIYYYGIWGTTDMSILLVYYFVPGWAFYLLCLLTLPTIILLVYFYGFFLESVHYLTCTEKNMEEAKRVIQILGTINGSSQSLIEQSKNIIGEVSQVLQKQQKQEKLTIKQAFSIIFNSKKYKTALICLIFFKMAYYCFYYGAQGSLERTGFNLGISSFLLGLGQFTGYFTGSYFIPQFYRRKVILISNLIVFFSGFLFASSFVQQTPLLGSLLLYIGATFSSYNLSALSLLETQSFPASVRSTSVGLIIGFGNVVRIFVPFAIGFFNEKGIHPNIVASFFVFLLGLFPVYYTEQTYGYTNQQKALIQTEMEAKIEND